MVEQWRICFKEVFVPVKFRLIEPEFTVLQLVSHLTNTRGRETCHEWDLPKVIHATSSSIWEWVEVMAM